MRILLLGEYSGFHKNLQSGLRKLGCDVVLASYGDGWKGISGDINLGRLGTKSIDLLINQFCIDAFKQLPKLTGFDVVQIINPVVFPCNLSGLIGSVFLNKIILEKIIDGNKKVFLSAAGNDAYYRSACVSKLFKYSPFEDEQIYDYAGTFRKYLGYDWSRSHLRNWNIELARNVAGVIPIAYDYSLPYRMDKNVNLCKTIPMPINVDQIEYIGVPDVGSLFFYHGLNRYGFKGTRHIEQAFNDFESKHGGKALCSIGKSMSLKNYLNFLSQVSVVVDQANSYSYGMNALYSMALGKIVFSGCENECQSEYGFYPDMYLENILPNSNHILSKMEQILSIEPELKNLSIQARQFVVDHHSDHLIAADYLNVWNS